MGFGLSADGHRLNTDFLGHLTARNTKNAKVGFGLATDETQIKHGEDGDGDVEFLPRKNTRNTKDG